VPNSLPPPFALHLSPQRGAFFSPLQHDARFRRAIFSVTAQPPRAAGVRQAFSGTVAEQARTPFCRDVFRLIAAASPPPSGCRCSASVAQNNS